VAPQALVGGDPDADLQVADVQQLPFEDGSFDAVCASFVFCSVPDAVRGLEEVHRVLRPGGQLVLLEHVLSGSTWLGWMMHKLDWIPISVWGAHIDRKTAANVRAAGFEEVVATPGLLDVFVEIPATKLAQLPQPAHPDNPAVAAESGWSHASK